MRLLLTSAGVTNPTIHAALVDLLPRPIEECRALAIPTAMHGHAMVHPERTWQFVAGRSPLPMTDLGWASVGLLELTALPSIPAGRWQAWVREADVLLVSGGDAVYLAHWMRRSGLADLLDDPALDDTVWVGLSAGSMVMTPRIGEDFMTWRPADEPDRDDTTLGVVDLSLFPHLGMPPENLLPDAERWAAELPHASYAIDDATALVVRDPSARPTRVEVVSEGEWHRLGPA